MFSVTSIETNMEVMTTTRHQAIQCPDDKEGRNQAL